MPWTGNDYHYPIKVLKKISENYEELSRLVGWGLCDENQSHRWEYWANIKIDFDRALEFIRKKNDDLGLGDFREMQKFINDGINTKMANRMVNKELNKLGKR